MIDFAEGSAYDLVDLRADLNRFTFLLGTGEGEGLFSAKAEWCSDGPTHRRETGSAAALPQRWPLPYFLMSLPGLLDVVLMTLCHSTMIERQSRAC